MNTISNVFNHQWMHLFSFVRQTNDVYCSFNQSAITSTGTTFPFFSYKRQYSHTKKKNQSGKKIYQIQGSKRSYPLKNSLRPNDQIDQYSSFQSLSPHYSQRPMNNPSDRTMIQPFDQIMRAKRRKMFLQRLFYTCFCVLVVIILLAVAIILIFHFLWINVNETLYFVMHWRTMYQKPENKTKQNDDIQHLEDFSVLEDSILFRILDMCMSICQEGVVHQHPSHIRADNFVDTHRYTICGIPILRDCLFHICQLVCSQRPLIKPKHRPRERKWKRNAC